MFYLTKAAYFRMCIELTPTADFDEHSSDVGNGLSAIEAEDGNTLINVPNVSETFIAPTVQHVEN